MKKQDLTSQEFRKLSRIYFKLPAVMSIILECQIKCLKFHSAKLFLHIIFKPAFKNLKLNNLILLKHDLFSEIEGGFNRAELFKI